MKKHPISSYNKYICLKADGVMAIFCLYLIKPFIIAASSAISAGKISAIDVLYPGKLFISLEAAAAIPVLLLLYAWSRRAPGASETIKLLCRKGKSLIITTAFLQFCIISSPLWLPLNNTMTNIDWIQVFLYLLIILTTIFSIYMKDCFADFPESDQDKV